jgi:predicted PurR-regulated permease PerM
MCGIAPAYFRPTMPLFSTNQQRASLVILLLGLGLLFALAPYLSGLVGGLVLYVIFAPVQAWLGRRLRPRLAAGLLVVAALVMLVVPAVTFTGLLLDQAQEVASGVIRGPLLSRIAQLEIGGVAIGPRLAGLGEALVTWVGSSAFAMLGRATRIGLNLTIALFLLYYLLLGAGATWSLVKPYLPFSPSNADLLRDRFRGVTISTVIGTGLIAVIQGTIVALAFWAAGLSNAFFWGVVTVVFAILPVVGSGLVWGPGALTLLLDDRIGAGVGLLLVGALVVGNVDVVIRPAVFRRFAQVHPLVTLVGAIGGVSYFGLLGILIGPLALSYFFELMRMYREEYPLAVGAPSPPQPPSPSP